MKNDMVKIRFYSKFVTNYIFERKWSIYNDNIVTYL